MENTMKMYITADEVAELLGVSRGYVDYRNQQRIMKDSAFWYKHVIETNGVEL